MLSCSPERDVLELGIGDPAYPARLRDLRDAPRRLYARGTLLTAEPLAVAIVGTRVASPYGLRVTRAIATTCARAGVCIVSGLARGIDAEAHRAALRAGGATVAVLGCGLANPYPAEHAPLFEEIVGSGGLVASEFPCDWPPLPSNFPRRNRIVSGLSLAVLVVEAARASGALITARIAVEDHGRQACAIPGPVDSARSAGCNLAIREGWAEPVLCPEDLVAAVHASSERAGGAPAANGPCRDVDPELATLVDAVADAMRRLPGATLDELAAAVPGAAPRIAAVRTLAELALAGAPAGQVQPMA
jgi:DNA processing protein